MNKKKMIIGIAAGVAVIGAVVTVIVKHNRKKKMRECELDFNDDEYDDYGDYEDEFWEEDLDDEDLEDEISPELEEKLAQYHEAAERLLAELENGNYGN